MNFKKEESELIKLVNRFNGKLDQDILLEINNFINVGEYGLAFEEFNNMLYEYDIYISETDYKDIIDICCTLNIDPNEWIFLKELID